MDLSSWSLNRASRILDLCRFFSAWKVWTPWRKFPSMGRWSGERTICTADGNFQSNSFCRRKICWRSLFLLRRHMGNSAFGKGISNISILAQCREAITFEKPIICMDGIGALSFLIWESMETYTWKFLLPVCSTMYSSGRFMKQIQ